MKQTRREFIRNSVVATAGLAVAVGEPPVASKGLLPTGKIGKLNITRLILGGNLLTRYQHSRDLHYLPKLVRSYNTDAKVRETIELAEASGINTLSVSPSPATYKTLNDHRKSGGKIQWILYATSNIEDENVYQADVNKMAESGAEAIYIWGAQGDDCVSKGKLRVLTKAIELIKVHDVPCGIGAHDLRVVQEIEKHQLPVDFYVKTLLHHHYPSAPRAGEAKETTTEMPGYWCRNPEETIEFMKTVSKPWIAFKVMAAGAIPPRDAFPYAFNNGADFIFAGMFDFDIVEDCQITREAIAKIQKRARPWRA